MTMLLDGSPEGATSDPTSKKEGNTAPSNGTSTGAIPKMESEWSKEIATIYRMVMPEHLCPYGLKAVDLLKRRGFTVDDHHLTTRAETDAFQKAWDVETTPQIFLDGERVGGLDDLRRHFNLLGGAQEIEESRLFGREAAEFGLTVPEDATVTYAPVVAIFGVAALLAIALRGAGGLETLLTARTLMLWGAFSMVMLAVQKLRDLEGFTNGFLGYDLLARRHVPYAYAYPFLEVGAAICLAGQVFVLPAAIVAIAIGGIGAVSVVKAVYIEKRSLTCACVGGGSKVPLGPVSLAEDVGMVVMGIWMATQVVLEAVPPVRWTF